jgi:hypothetical protein
MHRPKLSHLIKDALTTPADCPRPTLSAQIARTLRYRSASMGLPLTKNERQLRNLKDSGRGQRCFVIGGGPSLNRQDLTRLKNEKTFGVNAIYTNYASMGFYPTYYVVEDVFVAEDRANEINAFKESTKFFGNYFRYCLAPDDNTIWLNVIFDYRDYPDFPHFSEDALRRLWVGGTVTYLCMQLAFYFGFDEVYLIGFDHSYTIPKSALIEGTKITSTSADVNHFNANYFGPGKRWHDPRVDRMERAYRKAKLHFDRAGRKIQNATDGGQLEVFDRVDYASLF